MAGVFDAVKTNTFYHQASDRHYTIQGRDGTYYQRRHQTGFDGREINVVEKQIHFVVGSGNHARTFLHRTPQGKITELPVAWYSENGGYWAMNPGYDHANHYDFTREITHECLFCHNAYPEIAQGTDRFGSQARFPGRIPEGIDCQRCHGPGRRHIEAVQAGKREAIRGAIVNPARLSSERQLEICMQCHLETTSRRLPHSILRFDRGTFSYRPGEPLADYVLHFDHQPGTGRDDKFEIAHQAYRLRKSACFQKSAGRLTCTTCHDPHTAPRGPEAVEHYTRACLDCHSSELNRQIAASQHTSLENCLECHMPKRRTDDVVHVVMTDHFIQRRKPARDLLAPLKERHETEETAYKGPVVLYYPPQLPATPESELYLAVAQVKELTNLEEGITRLAAAIQNHRPEGGEFYFELAEAYGKAGRVQEAIRFYQEAVRRKPDFLPGWLGLGRSLSKSGRHARGAEILRKTLENHPRDPAVLNDLGLIYVRQGKTAEAAAAFRTAVEIDPAYSEAYNNLGGALTQSGDQSGAEDAYRNAIRQQPDFAGAHRNLANVLASRGEFAEAEYHFKKAFHHQPEDALAHFDYGVALAGREKYYLAQAQFEAAVRLDPALAEAHNALGDMLAIQGKASQAVQHYKRALELDPELAPAREALRALQSR
jgi:predicted CXXCH cytochrome family protein